MPNSKLLIVDDDAGFRSQLKWSFHEYELYSADSRVNAIELFMQYKPQVVTLDLGLAPEDADGISEGFATLSQILTLSPKTRVIILSASEITGNAEKAKSLGAFDYFSKPVDIESLLKVMKRAYSDIQ